MFSIAKLRDNIFLRTDQLDNIKKQIKQTVYENFENKVNNKINAYLVKIIDIDDNFDHGKINDIDGYVYYDITYIAVIFTPIKGQLLTIVVEEIGDIGLFGKPLIVPTKKNCVEIKCMCPKDIISGYEYKGGIWKNGTNVIKVSSEINIKILNFQIDFDKIVIIGTIE